MQRPRLRLGTRLAGELAVIFLGVVLALAADDWREGRAERAEARESLAVILTDLRRDSVIVLRYGELLRPRVEAAQRLLEDWDVSAQHPDTIAGRMRLALTGPRGASLRRAAFDGLVGSNGLCLIGDPSLRASASRSSRCGSASLSASSRRRSAPGRPSRDLAGDRRHPRPRTAPG